MTPLTPTERQRIVNWFLRGLSMARMAHLYEAPLPQIEQIIREAFPRREERR